MKKIIDFAVSLTTLILLIGLASGFSACTQQSPLAPAKQSSIEDKGLKILSLGDGEEEIASLSKRIVDYEWVTIRNGGELDVEHRGKRKGKKVQIHVNLKIEPHSISRDALLKLFVDTRRFMVDFDFKFKPHGIAFSSPAILNIEAKGLDLSGIDENKLGLYYDNPETGEWEPMEVEKIIINKETGYIRVINGQLPHFSRYAIGAE